MKETEEIIERTKRYGANNYLPLPVVVSEAEGVWVMDPEGNRYMDMLGAYSALNVGHRHPAVLAAVRRQMDRVTLTSRAFENDNLAGFYEAVHRVTGKEMILPMNTGSEAVETAIKNARRWAYRSKGVPADSAEIIACEGNFHGRTTTIISFSSEPSYRDDFGPFTPGFTVIPYGDNTALEAAINPNTAAFLVEPIQGEAGIRVPPEGYLREARALCEENEVLFLADEIQTGFGRTGKTFACDWEGVIPDIYILGKALGGGVFPVSAIAADGDVLGLFEPGSHGSTFGGNPLGAAAGIAALGVLEEESLADRSREMGDYLLESLERVVTTPHLVEIRGRGLFIGIELDHPARPYCEALKAEGVLAKETHENVVRLLPPLVITRPELDWALERIARVFA